MKKIALKKKHFVPLCRSQQDSDKKNEIYLPFYRLKILFESLKRSKLSISNFKVCYFANLSESSRQN